ncbi:oligodendrocyte-myelin glycoprotein isoform X1 [Nerophis lumbriciformis]|uniref:oligodendrocyte-myelin glycoprotein isoform X1 n=1 Tax=Nerophis lumbriciformis TaxID=546530 RepID=UPI002ADF7AB9|nr:oligodendrocyte-myelin glycoprotein isoform X1 [Nerophis lumbriciformis]
MRSRRAQQNLPPNEAPLVLLLVLLLGLRAAAVCPAACSCSHRKADCSRRGLRELPDGLRADLRGLNLSHNRLHNLDGGLASYTHLRVLDLSGNGLSRLPERLPRSLWQLHAASNRIRLLDKNDTVNQWNLRVLDLSDNELERTVFINNTLINLCVLNLSHNHLWTLPTNMPAHLEIVDISHNWLVKTLPGSLDRLPKLTFFYLHTNRLSNLPFGVLDKMTSLTVLTLGNNPWACHLKADMNYLLSWVQRTPALILGCPCRTNPICGGVHSGQTGGLTLNDNFHAHDTGSNVTTMKIPPATSSPASPRVSPHSTSASSSKIFTTNRPIRTTDHFPTTDSMFIQTKKMGTKNVRRQNDSSSTLTDSSLILLLPTMVFLCLTLP